MSERLQKLLAQAGVTSRRKAEELILQGRVKVNGKLITELGTKADADHDAIAVDGRLLNLHTRKIYIMLNKPRGYVTTVSDPEGRRTVLELIESSERLFPVGRLDIDTEGLLLLTNDGDFAFHLTHPRNKVAKTYQILLEGVPSADEVAQLSKGVRLDDGFTAPAQAKLLYTGDKGTWIELMIHEGRNRQVRRMIEHIGHRIRFLRRVKIGNLTLDGLRPGMYRELSEAEIKMLLSIGRS